MGLTPTADKALALMTSEAADAVARGIRMHERALLPAPESALLKALGVLATLTKARAEDGADLKLRLKAYAAKLSAYPADIAMHVLSTQAGQGPFFPAWSELEERLSWRARARRQRLEGLRELQLSLAP